MSDRIKDLLLYALCHHGAAATAAEIVDVATGLALADNWPTSFAKGLDARSAAKHLQADPRVKRDGVQGGRPLWAPAHDFNTEVPVAMPAPPAQGRTGHPLASMTTTQQFLAFDVLSDALDTLTRQDKERAQMYQRHLSEMCALAEKCKATLIAAGLKE